MAPTAAIDQERRARRPHPGVAKALEHGFHLVREVGHVHVVDGVVEGPEQTEGAGRLQRRAVLDVALLGTVVPVHAADPMPVRTDTGGDLRAGDGGHRRKGGDAVADQRAALEQGGEVRRQVIGHRAQEHVGAQRVDDDQAELARRVHRSESDGGEGAGLTGARAGPRTCAGRGGGGRSASHNDAPQARPARTAPRTATGRRGPGLPARRSGRSTRRPRPVPGRRRRRR